MSTWKKILVVNGAGIGRNHYLPVYSFAPYAGVVVGDAVRDHSRSVELSLLRVATVG